MGLNIVCMYELWFCKYVCMPTDQVACLCMPPSNSGRTCFAVNHVHSEGGGAVYAEDDNTLSFIGNRNYTIQWIMVVCCLLMRITLWALVEAVSLEETQQKMMVVHCMLRKITLSFSTWKQQLCRKQRIIQCSGGAMCVNETNTSSFMQWKH